MNKRYLVLVGLLASLFVQWSAAHPLAPSMLEFVEQGDGKVAVMWKTPAKGVPGSRLTPVLPKQCQQLDDATSGVEATAKVYRWHVSCGGATLPGLELKVDNIASSNANALARVELLDGRVYSQVLTPDNNSFIIPERQSAWQVFKQYLWLGFGHLVGGYDHVLFVLTLLFLVGLTRSLIATVTFFTIGHSATLSLAALGYVSFPQIVAEVIIALSIVMTAASAYKQDAKDWFRRRPWLVAVGFGLLHGLGFAGALSEVGLPQEEIPMALFSFNVGIELGQLAVIFAALVLVKLLFKASLLSWPYWRLFCLYPVGLLAAYWFWERVGQYLTGG